MHLDNSEYREARFTENMLNNQYFSSRLRFLFILIITLGIFFRLVNLDSKTYWHDETFTSLRISGYTAQEMVADIFNGEVLTIEDIQKYQYPNQLKNVMDTINSLAVEDPQHPPLYFVMLRCWTQLWGNSVAVKRSFSVVVSLLVFPSVYWLCGELFEKQVIGLVASAFFSLSPFHLLLAQEAREYILWLLTILLSSAALLRAIRLKTQFSWGIYAFTWALGLYSFLLTGLVAMAHGIYVLIMHKFRLSKTVIAYGLASVVGLLLFTPWLFIVANNVNYIHKATDWTTNSAGLSFLFKMWILNITHLFLDIEFSFHNPLTYLIWPLVILVGYSFYFLGRQTPMRVWLFIFILIGVTTLPLLLPDLILGGWRSGVPRYLIPGYLGIQLSVIYLIATKITARAPRIGQQKFWLVTSLILLSCGVISCASIATAPTWWNKYDSQSYLQSAEIVNQSARPLLISDNEIGNIVSFSYLLESKVKFQLVTQPNIPEISADFRQIFLFNPSKTMLTAFQRNSHYQLESIYRTYNHQLWQLKKL